MRTRVAALCVLCLAFGLLAAPARAQYAPKGVSDRATGETYHVEIGGYFWNPTPDISITSESLGIIGSRIDFVTDLGIEKARFRQVKVVLRPAKKHKFRFEYTPVSYHAAGTLSRDLVFNGILYSIALPVTTDFQWNAYRFGYEWDFIYTDRGQLVGHIVQCAVWIDRKVAAVEVESGEPFPKPMRDALQHIVLSHHGGLAAADTGLLVSTHLRVLGAGFLRHCPASGQVAKCEIVSPSSPGGL